MLRKTCDSGNPQGATRAASMRPQRNAAENRRRRRYSAGSWGGFNEAAA